MGQQEACRPPRRHGRSTSHTGQNRCGAERFSLVPWDEIATAIAAARGDLLVALRLRKVSIAERPESRRAVRYDHSIHIFFDRRV
jgi:hypothetical protein